VKPNGTAPHRCSMTRSRFIRFALRRCEIFSTSGVRPWSWTGSRGGFDFCERVRLGDRIAQREHEPIGTAASFSAIASRRSACARTITPPSEAIRPPSNAAVIFLLATAGKANGRNLSLVMAGVVRHDRVNRMALAPNSYARPIRYATPTNIQIPSL